MSEYYDVIYFYCGRWAVVQTSPLVKLVSDLFEDELSAIKALEDYDKNRAWELRKLYEMELNYD